MMRMAMVRVLFVNSGIMFVYFNITHAIFS